MGGGICSATSDTVPQGPEYKIVHLQSVGEYPRREPKHEGSLLLSRSGWEVPRCAMPGKKKKGGGKKKGSSKKKKGGGKESKGDDLSSGALRAFWPIGSMGNFFSAFTLAQEPATIPQPQGESEMRRDCLARFPQQPDILGGSEQSRDSREAVARPSPSDKPSTGCQN
eukprot:gene9607-biopygen4872